MGVSLRIEGKYDTDTTAADYLERLKGWFECDLAAHDTWGELRFKPRIGSGHEGRPVLIVRLHPAAEGVEILASGPARLTATAKTSLAGPGYHIALCQILKLMGEANGIRWRAQGGEDGSADDTGYFFKPDWRGVEKAMLRHLRTVAQLVETTMKGAKYGEMALSMPLNHTHFGGPIRTPTGVRDLAWLARVRDNTRNGLDIYPWWDEGLTATFYLGRAMTDLWMNVRWRKPEDEQSDLWPILRGVHEDLGTAYRMDPTLNYPWREWAELLDLMEPEPDQLIKDVRAFASDATRKNAPIGYRRHRVGVGLVDGWRMTIPGEFMEKWEEGSWCAWDGERTVWFSCWSFNTEDGDPPRPDELLDRIPEEFKGEQLNHSYKNLIGRAVIGPHEGEDGEAMFNLKGFSAIPGGLALCNIYYHKESDRQWAIQQWHTLVNVAPPKSKTVTRGDEQL